MELDTACISIPNTEITTILRTNFRNKRINFRDKRTNFRDKRTNFRDKK